MSHQHQQQGNSPHNQQQNHQASSTVWKVLHGAPPTPPPARRDPDRHPVINAGQQQKAAAAGSNNNNPYLQATLGLSSSAVSVQLPPSLHGTAGGNMRPHHQLSASMDDAGSFLHQQQQQQQYYQQQLSPSKQAWPSLSSPRGQQNTNSVVSPWGKLPAVPAAASPEHDPMGRNQVCVVCDGYSSCSSATLQAAWCQCSSSSVHISACACHCVTARC